MRTSRPTCTSSPASRRGPAAAPAQQLRPAMRRLLGPAHRDPRHRARPAHGHPRLERRRRRAVHRLRPHSRPSAQLRPPAVHRPGLPRAAPRLGARRAHRRRHPAHGRPPRTPTTPNSPSWSASCPCKTPTSAPGGPPTRSTGTSYGTKHYRHPLVGDLTLDCDTWDSPDGSGQRLMVLTAEPGTPSHDRLRILAALTGGRAAPVVARIGPGDLERAAVASWLSWCATRKRIAGPAAARRPLPAPVRSSPSTSRTSLARACLIPA